jgi:D-alanyl-D-alanine carboxypeptidase
MRVVKPFLAAFVVALALFAAPVQSASSAILVDTNGDGGADKAYIVKDADTGNIVGI